MKPDKTDNRKPLDQSDLAKLPRNSMAKKMRNPEELMADYISNGEKALSNSELRLVDLLVFEKTGKHINKFKDPKPPKDKPKVTGHKLKLNKNPGNDTQAVLDDTTEDIIAQRIADNGSQNVS